ncbi:MAG: vanadium-dependent haloperoxidase [Steroidobacteraceae bacterium]
MTFGAAAVADRPRTERDFLGPRFEARLPSPPAPETHRPRRFALAADTLRYWNQVAVDASGLDHTPPAPGEDRVFGEQLGPGRSSWAMAVVHIAMFDAVNAIVGGYQSYTGIRHGPRSASVDAAIAQAAHDTLIAVFPSQRERFDALLAEDLRQIRGDWRKRREGRRIGRRAAAAILALRRHDGSRRDEPEMGTEWITSEEAGHWRQDPIGLAPIALGAKWGKVDPFVLRSLLRFRAPPPPAMSSEAYTRAFNEAKALGGDGLTTPTERSQEQTRIGIFWAYDGTPSLCAPPRLYNQIVATVSERNDKVIELARLFALVNVAMADAGIAIWESKYVYDFWRPVTGIREADEGTGPTGAGDGNPATLGDPAFVPLGAPASNLAGPNFTPPFPAYPSGHAGFGGALFQILRRFYGTDRVAFTFVSDEFNGVTVGNDGEVRPYFPRSFNSFSEAEEENGQSRIYLGIHWAFDKTAGIRQGRRVANYVFDHAFRPVSN